MVRLKTDKIYGQCWRCEFRAQAHESGHGPRCECTMFDSASCGCYMYRPVRPLIQVRATGDRRPIGAGALLSPRMRAVAVADCKLEGYIDRTTSPHSLVVYQKPIKKKAGNEGQL